MYDFFVTTATGPRVDAIEFAGGSSWTPTHTSHGFVVTTWTGDVVPMQPEPLVQANRDESLALLERHMDQLDDVYRRL